MIPAHGEIFVVGSEVVGLKVGSWVGLLVGFADCLSVGSWVGLIVGLAVCFSVGSWVGLIVGFACSLGTQI